MVNVTRAVSKGGRMKTILGLVVLLIAEGVSGQTWPDFYLTNGTHYTTYDVETYDPLNPVKNLYIEGEWSGSSEYPEGALVYAGDSLSNIHDSNHTAGPL